MGRDELTRWALRAEVASTRQAGADRIGRVLVALVQYANVDGIAWPSTDRLADDVHGLDRRDVRNALEALVAQGWIEAVEPSTRGRVTRYRINTPRDEVAGIPAMSSEHDLAGELAGHMAGELAGTPAVKGTEVKNPPTPREPSELDAASGGEGIDLAALSPEAAEKLARRLGGADMFLAARRLARYGITEDDLAAILLDLGEGDADAGYTILERVTFDYTHNTRDPFAVLVFRLREAGASAMIVDRLRRRYAGHRAADTPRRAAHGRVAADRLAEVSR